MNVNRLMSLSMACQEATGGYPPDIVDEKGMFTLDGIQFEVDDKDEPTGRWRSREGVSPDRSPSSPLKMAGGPKLTSRPAGITMPKGDWPAHWADYTHEYDGHGIDALADDRDGEELLDRELASLYIQHGIEEAVDDVSGANLGPKLVHQGRALEID